MSVGRLGVAGELAESTEMTEVGGGVIQIFGALFTPTLVFPTGAVQGGTFTVVSGVGVHGSLVFPTGQVTVADSFGPRIAVGMRSIATWETDFGLDTTGATVIGANDAIPNVAKVIIGAGTRTIEVETQPNNELIVGDPGLTIDGQSRTLEFALIGRANSGSPHDVTFGNFKIIDCGPAVGSGGGYKKGNALWTGNAGTGGPRDGYELLGADVSGNMDGINARTDGTMKGVLIDDTEKNAVKFQGFSGNEPGEDALATGTVWLDNEVKNVHVTPRYSKGGEVGTKCSRTLNSECGYNLFDTINGNALWYDIDNAGAELHHNDLVDCNRQAIYWEISWGGHIHRNRLTDCGYGTDGMGADNGVTNGAAIGIQSSGGDIHGVDVLSDGQEWLLVEDNLFINNWRAFWIDQDNRSNEFSGVYPTRTSISDWIYFRNNDITMRDADFSQVGGSGDLLNPNSHFIFRDNTYRVLTANANVKYWSWGGTRLNFTDWTALSNVSNETLVLT